MDLKVTAESNSSEHVRASRDVINNDKSGQAEQFFQHMALTVAITAFDLAKLRVFHAAGSVLPKIGLLRHQHPTASDDEIEALASRDTWYVRRKAFEDHWDRGRDFVYFAVAIEGMGASEYGFGDFVLVMDRAQAVFPKNTAEYADSSGVLDLTCDGEVATWSDRVHLLVVKHAAEIPSVTASHRSMHPSGSSEIPSMWARMICDSQDVLTEAVYCGPIKVQDFKELRITRAHFERMRLAAVKANAGLPLNTAGQQDAQAYSFIRTWETNFDLAIEKV